MSIADDYVTVSNAMDRHDREGHEALQRIKAAHQRYRDAAKRLTDLANEKHAVWLRQTRGVSMESLTAPQEIRESLGDAYLGGLLQ